jgi:methionine synthase II (cobalamin-independent)
MTGLEFNCLPTIIGSMPHTDPAAACAQVLAYLKDIPAWPQLPRRDFKENMNAQFSEGFPGIQLTNDNLTVDRTGDFDDSLERFYTAYLEEDIDKYPTTAAYAAGLHAFLERHDPAPLAVKGQITGPLTWGLSVTDNEGKAILYDDVLGDAVAKFLRLKAAWQEKQLSRISPNTIMFVDEPYMASFGSVAVPLSKERVVLLLEEVFSGIKGIRGVHCCGNTDWSVILETSLDILSFDAYNYAQSLSLYPKEVKRFLDRKGVIAWGVVPNDSPSLSKESAATLKDRLEEAMLPFTRNGVSFEQLVAQSMITPSCTLASLPTPDASAHALELLAELSKTMRSKH